ncbi:MAG: NAD(P)/FAD-dependent oxidoreductase [Spirochaetales bacterium]|nr:NAD(P)/FAD-dependent oxidoreductase [Spirochaetales bacterium]
MKKMVIVGAGISGLSTGCYAQLNGYSSAVYEMHSQPGGVCTSWKRGNYLFDHCLHWVLGSNKSTSLYPIFRELGIADKTVFHYTKRFRKISFGNKTIIVYTDIDKLEAELVRHFPEEKRALHKMFRLVRFYAKFDPPMNTDFGNFSPLSFIKLLPFIPSFMKLKGMTSQEYFRKMFRNPELVETLHQMFPVRGLPALFVIMPLAFFQKQEGGYPLGGSLNFAKQIEKKYLDLGGTIHYKKKVVKIAIENNSTKGIVLEDNSFVSADIIVSACDGHFTLFTMLGGGYLTRRIRFMYENPSLWPPLICISLGVRRDFSREVELNNIKLEKPVNVCNREVSWFHFAHYAMDPSFAPKGKSVVSMQIETDYDYWARLYKKPAEYSTMKKQILLQWIDILESKFPGIKKQIEVTDIATPVTWERYTGNWRASYEGWIPTVKLFGKNLPTSLPGLRNFWMTGQWIFPGGGVPMCMAHARNLIRKIKRKDKKA